MNQFRLHQQVRRETVIFFDSHDRSQTLDLCFTSKDLANKIIRCDVIMQLNHDSNHFFIETILDFTISKNQQKNIYVWDKTNSKDFNEKFRKSIVMIFSMMIISSRLDDYAHCLLLTLQEIIVVIVLKKRINNYIISEFISKCKTICIKVQKTRKREQSNRRRLNVDVMRTLVIHHRYKTLLHKKKKLIVSTLKQIHRDLVEAVMSDVDKIWKLAK